MSEHVEVLRRLYEAVDHDVFAAAGITVEQCHAAIEAGIAALSRSEVPAGWQPIETAPTCEEVLVYVPLWRGPMPCMFVDGVWYDQNSHMRAPTHWMPLPDNPTPPAQGEQAEVRRED